MTGIELMSRSSRILTQFLCFASIGVLGTAAHYLTLITLVQIFTYKSVYSSIIGFIVGALVNYFLNYRFTFKSDKGHQETMIKFFIVAFMGLMINTFIMTVATEILNLHYLLAQVIGTGIVFFCNFIGNLLWTFRRKAYET
jgi:putative flippase GtrA